MEETYIDSDGQELEIVIDSHGTKWYYNSNHKLHRLDGPAVEWTDGAYSWRKNGISHRIGGPQFFDLYFNPPTIWVVNNNTVEIYYICG